MKNNTKEKKDKTGDDWMTNETPGKVGDDWITVVLLTPHVHAGTNYNAGEKLKVNPAMKKWLIDLGVVAPD